MNQFVLQQGRSAELELFPHIMDLSAKKNSFIWLDSLSEPATESMRIYFAIEGKFVWYIHQQQYILYPCDVVLVPPEQKFGGEKDYLDIGSISGIHSNIQRLENGKMMPGKWSRLSESESLSVGKMLFLNNLLVLPKFNKAGRILQYIQSELVNKEIGYSARAGHLIDELFITITRQLTKQSNPASDFPNTFTQLEQTRRQDIPHHWTIEKKAATAGIGATLFNEKVKTYSGFSPIDYLINILISEASKLPKKKGIRLARKYHRAKYQRRPCGNKIHLKNMYKN